MSDTAAIIQAITEHLGLNPEDIDRESRLQEDLGLGPLELHDLLLNLSNKFGVSIEPADSNELQTISDLIMLMEDKLIEK